MTYSGHSDFCNSSCTMLLARSISGKAISITQERAKGFTMRATSYRLQKRL